MNFYYNIFLLLFAFLHLTGVIPAENFNDVYVLSCYVKKVNQQNSVAGPFHAVSWCLCGSAAAC